MYKITINTLNSCRLLAITKGKFYYNHYLKILFTKRKTLKILFVFIVLINILNGEIFDLNELTSKKSILNNSLKIELFDINKKLEEGTKQESFIYITVKSKKYLLRIKNNKLGLISIEDFKIISDNSILINLRYTTKLESWHFNLDTKKFSYIGNGKVKSVAENKFLLKNSKGYIYVNGKSIGAYWVDKLVDKDGNLIELISKPKNNWGCQKISTLINQKNLTSKFIQSIDDCVYVER